MSIALPSVNSAVPSSIEARAPTAREMRPLSGVQTKPNIEPMNDSQPAFVAEIPRPNGAVVGDCRIIGMIMVLIPIGPPRSPWSRPSSGRPCGR